ncbi:phosphoribosylanthranilate isomerase [Microbacteriaceae bacterium 4G12]
MKAKICGITDVETAQQACLFGADALGFVFAPSKRRISPENAVRIITHLPQHVWKVGVFVNEDVVRVREIAKQCQLDYVQLHGEEDQHYLERLNIPSIKAFGVSSKDDIERACQYEADYILLDSPKGAYYGGNGTAFDWSYIKNVPRTLRAKLIVAGGLTDGNVKEVIHLAQPYMVDASSSLETNGKKDIEKIKRFLQTIKGC